MPIDVSADISSKGLPENRQIRMSDMRFATNGDLIQMACSCLAELVGRGNEELRPAYDLAEDFRAKHTRLKNLADTLATRMSND